MNETLLKATKFTVQRREFTVPGHGSVRRELVVHPGAVLILPVRQDGQVVLIRNYRFSVSRELLELPAGTIDPGETPEACAPRELEEETGYVAARIELLCRFYTSPGFCDELMHCYVATGLRETKARPEATEQIQVAVMPLEDAYRACLDGRIEDGKTLAALLYYRTRGERVR